MSAFQADRTISAGSYMRVMTVYSEKMAAKSGYGEERSYDRAALADWIKRGVYSKNRRALKRF